MPDQQSLWHDTVEEALRDVVIALGGPQKVGYRLWPGKGVIEAGKHLNRVLNPERPEKPTIGEFILLLQWGREAGVHTAWAFMAQDVGYRWEVLEPEDERARLQREVIETGKRMEAIFKQLQRNPGGG